MSRRFRAPAAFVAGGVAASAAIAAVLDITVGDLLVVLALTAAGALIVILLGAGVRAFVGRRNSTIGAQSAMGAVLTAAATVAAFGMVSATMLDTEHDLAVILAVLPLAASAGIAYGIATGRRVTADLLAVAAAVRSLKPGEEPALDFPVTTSEVATVADALRVATTRLAEAAERQQMLEASRRDLIAWASHDLRTPLASLRALAEALADDVAPDEAARRRYLAGLTIHVDRLTALVDDLFELAQIDAGGIVLQLDALHVPTLVNEVVGSFESGAQVAGVSLKSVPAGNVSPVPAGRDQVGRVLANLLHNAIRHTRPGGNVRVEVVEQPGGVLVAVEDGCGGIPPADLPRVFDRFWRGDPARTPDGAGLGLAIAQGLIEAHGGTIGVTNTTVGCRIQFVLPRPTPG